MSSAASMDLKLPAIFSGGPTRLLIDGRWVPAVSGKVFDTYNPSTGEVIAQLAEGDREDVEHAVAAARRAFEGPWARLLPIERQRLLLAFADQVEKRAEELALIDSYDMGIPIQFGLVQAGGFQPAEILRYYAGWPARIYGETTTTSMPGAMLTYTLREPIGVVAAIIPWNAPRWAVAAIAPALAAGCTMILKPSELGSLAPLVLGEIAQEVGIPDGVLNIITGYGRTAGAALAEHPGVDKITFVGSTATGQSLVRASAGNLKRLTLELGGKSPDIVFDDADLELAVPNAAMAIFGNSGQMCTAGSRIFVQRSIHEKFLERLIGIAQSLKVGSALDTATMIGPLVSAGQLERVQGYLESGKKEGGEVLTGGERLTGDLANGYFIPPTVFTGVSDTMRIAREEIFGPVAMVLPFDDIEEVIRRANDTHYGLVGGVWTRDLARAHRTARALKSGVVWVNTYNALDPAMPFGGRQMSGIGSQHGAGGLDAYLSTKSIWIAGI